jgi:outer membrane receptor protein involved in Fe transport
MLWTRSLVLLLFVLSLTLSGNVAWAQEQPAVGMTTVAGRILETSAGLPVSGAAVTLRRGATSIDSTRTAGDGSFSLNNVAPGEYSLLISASGYQTTLVPSVVVAPGQGRVDVQTALTPAATGTKVIGSVSVAAKGALQTTATINQNLNPSVLQDQNYLRAGDALGTLPFVTAQTSSSTSDDETLQLRGFDPSESVALLDGHPIGPLGACPSAANPLVGGACPYNAQGSVFDYQLAQFWGMSNINVTYGSGALGLYGVPTLGGSVDFQTLRPTQQDHVTLLQGYGDLSKTMTGLSYTGTFGRLGFAFAYGVEGTNGEVNGEITQTAMLSGANIIKALGGKDQQYCVGSPAYALYGKNVPATLTAADVAACTVEVGSQNLNRNALAKLVYQVDPKTSLLVTVYNANTYANGIGNGENYTVPYDQVLNQADAVLASGKNNFKLLPSGKKTTCSSTTLAVLTNSTAGYTCLTAVQFANDFDGPYDKGPGVFHAALNQDYHAQVTRQIGAGVLSIDGYIDNYDYLNQKSAIIGYDEQDTWFTHGAVISDEYAGRKNDLTFGVSFTHQMHATNQWTSPPCAGNCAISFPFGDTNYFIHDTYTASKHLAIFGDFVLNDSKVSSTLTFDPRISFVFRPDASDVFRVTGGAASISPDPVLYNGGTYPPSTLLPTYNQLASGALNGFEPTGPGCTPLIPVIQGFNPNVKPEVSDDIEVALAHRFANQASLEVDAYNSTETNPIITDVAPLSSLPASLLATFQAQNPTYFTNALGELNGPGGCGSNYTQADLGVSTPLNAGGAAYRGVHLSAKIPVTRQFELDAGYTVQTAYYTGLPEAVLVNNGGYVNGQQFYGIPTDTGSLGLGYANAAGGWSARIDGYYVGNNNAFYRPAYSYANANVARTVGPITFNLGISNLFNSVAQSYGILNAGIPYPQNQYVTTAPTRSEEYGLPARQVWLTATIRT